STPPATSMIAASWGVMERIVVLSFVTRGAGRHAPAGRTDKTEMGPLARLLLGHNATHGECTRAPPDQGRQIPLKTRSQSEVGSDPVGRCSLTSSLSGVDQVAAGGLGPGDGGGRIGVQGDDLVGAVDVDDPGDELAGLGVAELGVADDDHQV